MLFLKMDRFALTFPQQNPHYPPILDSVG